MSLIASLPWYDHPASSLALDRFWSGLRSQLVQNGLVAAPRRLNRSDPLPDQWQHPGLILSQCCGPDLFTIAAERVSCLGRPIFQDLDCPPGYYYSHIVSRGVPPSKPAVAINSPTSWSGNTALGQWLRERGDGCSSCVITGSHENSLRVLRRGEVDLIAIDAHTWTLLDKTGVDIIGRSTLAITPPFISGIADKLTREAIEAALVTALASNGYSIGISGALSASRTLYDPVKEGTGIDLSGSTHRQEAAPAEKGTDLFSYSGK